MYVFMTNCNVNSENVGMHGFPGAIFKMSSKENNIRNVNSGPPRMQSMVGRELGRPLVHSFHHKSILFWKLRAHRTRICNVNKKIFGSTPCPGAFSKWPPHKNAEKPPTEELQFSSYQLFWHHYYCYKHAKIISFEVLYMHLWQIIMLTVKNVGMHSLPEVIFKLSS